MKPDLAIIVPFAGEYPQVLFTIQAIAKSLLKSDISFEIIAVDNYCEELENQWSAIDNREALQLGSTIKHHSEVISDIQIKKLFNDALVKAPSCQRSNKAGEAIKASVKGNKWLKYIHFDERLSHWECKRLACDITAADTFLFIDAHCIPSLGIDDMFKAYSRFRDDGTFHMPLTYKILEWHRLVYKLVIENGFWGYSFTPFPSMDESTDEMCPPEVPCMSTCGMMISRKVYEKIGGWPKHMTMYGGGENFINFALAATGMKKWVFPQVTLHHHGEARDYHYTHDGIIWNRLIAHYLFAGFQGIDTLAKNSKGHPDKLSSMVQSIIKNEDLIRHRKIIKKNTTVDLNEWRESWEG